MNRRGFLAQLAAATTAALLDPERLAWELGPKKTIIDLGAGHVGDPQCGWGNPLLIEKYRPTISVHFKAGDIITISGAYGINPATEFVVTAVPTGTEVMVSPVWPPPLVGQMPSGPPFKSKTRMAWKPPVQRARHER